MYDWDGQSFNPFFDRLSRDLRNDLSGGFAVCIETGNSEALDQTVAAYRSSLPEATFYSDYLENRLIRYQESLSTIDEKNYLNPIQQAIVLWNNELFFEMHEVLEHLWYDARGEKKLIFQALIRAAGVYIKSEYNFHEVAERIAKKVTPVLLQHRHELIPLFDVDALVSALGSPISAPPKLSIVN